MSASERTPQTCDNTRLLRLTQYIRSIMTGNKLFDVLAEFEQREGIDDVTQALSFNIMVCPVNTNMTLERP